MKKTPKPAVFLGQVSIDHIYSLNFYPLEDSKSEVKSLQKSLGGPAAIAGATISRLGEKIKFIGLTSSDDDGEFIKKELKKYKMDLSLLHISKTSQKAFITVNNKSGSRTIFYELPVTKNPKGLSLNRNDLKAIKDAPLLMVDSMFLNASLNALKIARENNVPTIIDTGSYKKGITKLLKYCDHIVVPEEFSKKYGINHKNTIDKLKKFKPLSITITLGPKGSITWSLDRSKTFKTPALKIKAIDTTGAGDAFHGAYAFGITQNFSIEKTLKLATIVAGLKCQNAIIPSKNAAFKLLNN